MARPLLGLLLWLISASPLWAIDFSHYHSQEEINAYLHDVARAHPQLVHFKFLGYSQGGREIDYVVISKGDAEQLPAIYLNGTHHGDEKSSTETVLGLVDFLVKNANRMADVSELLDSYAVYLQPLVNPDGYALNSRYDSEGRDPNRDYSYPGRSDEESFKIPAIRLVKELTDKAHFRAAVAFHSGMEGVLWAWAYTNRKSPDTDTLYTLSKLTAQAMHFPRYLQSFDDYPSNGEFIDYVMSHGTLAITVEVSNDPTPPPPQLASVVRRGIAGGMTFMLGILELDRGELRVEPARDAPSSSRALLTARDGTLPQRLAK